MMHKYRLQLADYFGREISQIFPQRAIFLGCVYVQYVQVQFDCTKDFVPFE